MDGVTALATQVRAEPPPTPSGGALGRGCRSRRLTSAGSLRSRALVGRYALISGGADEGGLDRVPARRLCHHPGAAEEPAHRMKADGTSADGVQGLELRLGRLAPQHAGGDIFNVRHGLRRKVDLEPDTPVHLLAAGQ